MFPGLDQLLSTDLSTLDQVGLQDRAIELQRTIDRLAGHLHQVLGELDARGDGSVVANPHSEGPALYRPVQHWWRDAAILTGAEAGRQVRHARVLRDLPGLQAAVVDGTLRPEQARVLSRLHSKIELQDLQDSQPQLLAVARPLNTEALGRFVSHLIATHCEPALEADQDRAHERRYLQLRTESDGTVHGSFLLASEDAEAVLTVLEPLARRQQQADQRSAGQRRADALVSVFTAAAAWMDLPHAGGQRAQLSYVVPAGWAAAEQTPSLAQSLAANGQHPLGLSLDVATGAWTGPQTRARIESVLCDARISRVFLDPTGQVTSLHSLDDQITPAQRKAVSARDRHCVAKGCTRPPAFCDVHHLQSRSDGGLTCVENLASCKYTPLRSGTRRCAVGRAPLHAPMRGKRSYRAVVTRAFPAAATDMKAALEEVAERAGMWGLRDDYREVAAFVTGLVVARPDLFDLLTPWAVTRIGGARDKYGWTYALAALAAERVDAGDVRDARTPLASAYVALVCDYLNDRAAADANERIESEYRQALLAFDTAHEQHAHHGEASPFDQEWHDECDVWVQTYSRPLQFAPDTSDPWRSARGE